MDKTYNKVIDILYAAKKEGVELLLNGEILQFKIEENRIINEALLNQIRENKPAIIAYLSSGDWKVRSVTTAANTITRFDRTQVKNIPLSFSQERLWFTDQLQGSVHYHSPTVMRLRGDLNIAALSRALETIVDRHDVLRTTFQESDGQVYQKIKDTQNWKLQVSDGEQYLHDPEGLAARIELLIKTPFDLSSDYPVRGALIRISDQEYVLAVIMHHIISDAWSFSVIVKELVELYNCFEEGKNVQLKPLPLQFADYAVWQRNYLQGDLLDKKIAYWKTKLEGLAPLQLETDFIRPLVKGTRGASVSKKIGKETVKQLNELVVQHGTSMFMILLSSFKILLYRYSGQTDISVGTSIASRQQKELENLIGFFVNTLTLRDELVPGASFLHLLDQVRTTTLEAYDNQELPFEKVVELVASERDMSRSPLFQVMLVLQNTPEAARLTLGKVELSREPFSTNISKFDCTFFITEGTDGFNLLIQYSTDLFQASTIERMAGNFEVLLRSIVQNPQQQIGLLPILTAEEEAQLVESDMSSCYVNYPFDSSITALFEEQVAKFPDSLALSFEGQELTYHQLNFQANQLAQVLKEGGIGAGALVPLFIERSNAMIVGMLGIMKAGAAYVPLDLDFPKDRIAYMLNDIGAKVVVSDGRSVGKLPSVTNLMVVSIDALNGIAIENLDAKPLPESLAYVIYTSGTTGKPKGVMVDHRNLTDYYYGLKNSLQIDQCKSFALVSTIATDLGNTVIFSSLLSGGLLHIFSKESVSNIEYLHQYFGDHRIDCLKIVPSHWKALSTDNLLLPKKILVFGGEALSREIVNDISAAGSMCRVVNHYGPTETTIGKLLHEVKANGHYGKTIPIGKPFSNTTVYILSAEMQLCPMGAPGQLFIAGDGISNGYYNNVVLTAEKFVKNPFIGEKHGKMYSTGDRVKFLPDGNISFMGRIDNQVKIRGYRIEPGEIENILQECTLINQAAVLSREDTKGNTMLVAYVVPEGGFDKEGIVNYLKELVPDYMTPSVFVQLKDLPLTANGKIDRKALLLIEMNDLPVSKFVAPQNETETRLAEIWEQILEVDNIGMNDDFFELGGHSLLAVRLVSAIRKAFKVEMPIGDIFDFPTVALLSLQLKNNNENDLLPVIEKLDSRPDLIPLSFSQERLWFIDQLGGSLQYHVAAVIKLTGNLNKEALAFALQKTVDRHEVLRTIYKEVDGAPYQFIQDSSSWTLDILDAHLFCDDEIYLQKLTKELINKPFILSADFMLRATLIDLKENEYMLVVTLHHIASDGWSRSILVNDFTSFYKAFIQGGDGDLAILPIQYADYAIWQQKHLEGDVLLRKIAYWKSKLTGVQPLNLPSDFHRPAIQSTRGAIVGFNIGTQLSNSLQQLSLRNGATLFMTLIAVFKVLLQRYSGQSDICVGTPTAGRHQQEVEGLIGFFVNTLAIRSTIDGKQSFLGLLQQVRNSMLEAYANQEAPFEKVVEAVINDRDMSRSPVFQAMFVLRNTPEVPNLVMKDVQLSRASSRHNTSLFDLTLYMTETEQGLQGNLEYCTDLFTEDTMRQFIGHYQHLLELVIENPEQEIGLLPMLSKQERHRILYDFNDTKVVYENQESISGLFELQVSKTPDVVAVVFDEQQLTYHQLNQQANQLAHFIGSKNIKSGSLIPICVERSLEMIVGVIGILKAGCTYVPIDSDYPEERVKYMLQDTGAEMIICSKGTRTNLPEIRNAIYVEVNGQDLPNILRQPDTNLQLNFHPNLLAYIIYTSGTTGRPKGVQMPVKALVNLLNWQDNQFVNRKRNVLQFASLNFDVSFQEIFSTLCFGSSLFLITSDRRRDMMELLKDVVNYKISHLFIPYIVLKNFVENIVPQSYNLLSLEEIIVAGEQLKITEDIHDFVFTNRIQLINHYGPTEAHVVSSYAINNSSPLEILPPIGKPISNTQLYILDGQGQPVPIGVTGELLIGGIQVAQGYHQLPDLTNEKFIQDNFSIEQGRKLYKTGDIARWRVDGNIDYLGRKDDQVKIRGYRVELVEIERVLQECVLVKQTAVVTREDSIGGKQLIGYIVPEGVFDRAGIMNHLKASLPEFMVPAILFEMENLPVTGNGKVDRKNLPDPGNDQLPENNFVAPRNEIELAIAEIWQDLLKVERIGIHDNFFDLGGHSLLAIRLVHLINKKLQFGLSINSLFIHPTIEGLIANANHESKQNDHFELVKPVEIKYLVPIKKGAAKKTPLYIVCGGGGSAIRFRRFAEMLDKDQPVYSLQSPIDAKNLAEFPTTIESIAAYFISEISIKNPDGPYALSGHCLGGIIAFEMAKQLEAKGKKVSFLAMFDTIIRKREPRQPSGFKNFYNIPKKTKKMVANTLRRLDFQSFLWRNYTIKALNYKINSFNKMLQKARKKINNLDELEYVGLEIFSDSAEAYKMAALKYKLQPYSGELLLFFAKERYMFTDVNNNIRFKKIVINEGTKNLWKQYAEGISIFEVEGDHSNMFEKSRGTAFARLVQQLLNTSQVKQVNPATPQGNVVAELD